ncbi:alpha/beta hydrolase family protein [Brevundimonas sp.]|uniref:alpha/beta hydrolase family protein n=1 Tax=Brevundimonas sp. TaxID=1871086 RepID=UPI003D6C7A73
MTSTSSAQRWRSAQARHDRLLATLSRRGLLGFGAGLAASGAFGVGVSHAREEAKPHSLDAFFTPDVVVAAALSPAGDRVAVLRNIGENGARRLAVEVVDAADPTGPRRVVPIGDQEVETLAWANDRRVLMRLAIPVTAGGTVSIGSKLASRTVDLHSRRMISVDLDTGGAVVLFGNERNRQRESLNLGAVVDYLPNDPDHVLMAAREYSGRLALHRVSVYTGRASLVDAGNTNTLTWATRDGVPVMRIDTNARGSMFNIFVRAGAQGSWKRVWRQSIEQARSFFWIAATDRPGVALVAARLDGEDVMSIRDLDLETLEFGPPKASRPGLDISDYMLDAKGDFMGALFFAPRAQYDFVDADMAPHHLAMNRFFDDECNVVLGTADAARNRFVVYATGPREPGAWYLYDKAARNFEYLGSRTQMETDRLGPTETLAVPTRDGATIEAFLTAPPSRKPGPLIALVHGGPEVRDTYDWDREAQALAAQGWWVVQPNFRGSGGFGKAFAREGYRRWGERMQEDVEDAVAHAVRTRGLDADRVAIMGTSYGGYAALMGAVRRPDLYKTAISICGVGDLGDMLDHERRDDDSPDGYVYRLWADRIGDPQSDAAMIEAASPRRRADEIACPVLLVHGEDDAVVPVHQSRRMHDALRAAGKTVDYVEVTGAGHADWEDEIDRSLMRRYTALLRQAFA